MISRRLLRIKALMIIYAFNRKEGDDLEAAEKELMQSVNKSYDLYHYLLLLVLEIVDIAAEKIEIARNKKIPSYEDLNPNTRFIDNRVVRLLENNQALVGKTLDVLVEGQGQVEDSGEPIAIGRTYRDAPEIDGVVLIEGEVPVGEMAPVRMTGAMTYDLVGTVDIGGPQLVGLDQVLPADKKSTP